MVLVLLGWAHVQLLRERLALAQQPLRRRALTLQLRLVRVRVRVRVRVSGQGQGWQRAAAPHSRGVCGAYGVRGVGSVGG